MAQWEDADEWEDAKWEDAPQNNESRLDKIKGVGEAGLGLATGMIAQIPASIGALLHIGNEATQGRVDTKQAEKVFEVLQRKMSYEPRTELGKEYLDEAGKSQLMQTLNAVGGVAHTLPPVRTAPSPRSLVPKDTPIPQSRFDKLNELTKPKEEPVAPKPDVIQPELDLFSPDQKQVGQSPFDAVGGKWIVDENGIPVKQMLSEEAARSADGGQMRLFEDPANPVDPVIAKRMEQQAAERFAAEQELTKRKEIDDAYRMRAEEQTRLEQEAKAARRDEILTKLEEEISTERVSKGQQRKADRLRAPRSQRGAIDPEALTEGFQKLFHGGKEFTEWNPKKIGSGEGMGALGPGLYTSDNPKLAALYKKYGDDVHFDNGGNMVVKPGVLNELAVDTRKILDYRAKSDKWEAAIKNLDALGYKASSRGIQGALQEAHKWRDEANARKAMIDAGIDGMYVQLGETMGKEIVIFNPSIIRQISRTDTPVVKLPKSQRGGIDIKAIGDSVKEAVKKITGKTAAIKDTTVATKESVLASIPGHKEAMKDYIPADPTAAEILTESLGAGDSKLKMTGVQSGATMTGIKYNSPLIQGIGRLGQVPRRQA